MANNPSMVMEQPLLQIAWLNIDGDDNKLSHFFRYLIGTLQTLEPRVRAETAAGSSLQILVVTGFIATTGLGIWLLISILKGTT
jgi:hypothetical protein